MTSGAIRDFIEILSVESDTWRTMSEPVGKSYFRRKLASTQSEDSERTPDVDNGLPHSGQTPLRLPVKL